MLNRAHLLHRQAEKAARKGNVEEAIQVRNNCIYNNKNNIYINSNNVSGELAQWKALQEFDWGSPVQILAKLLK